MHPGCATIHPVTEPADPKSYCRIGVVCRGEAKDAAHGVALRTLELLLIQRLPAAYVRRCFLDVSERPTTGNARASDHRKPPREESWATLRAENDLLFLWYPSDPEALRDAASAATARGAEVVLCSEAALTVCELAVTAQEFWFAEGRRGLLRALGWLPPDPAARYTVVDASPAGGSAMNAWRTETDIDGPAVFLGSQSGASSPLGDPVPHGRLFFLGQPSGVDELVAVIAGAESHIGDDPLVRAIMRGRSDRSTAAEEVVAAIDAAARAATVGWHARRGHDWGVDSAVGRGWGIERAAFQCELHLAQVAAEDAQTELASVVGSRSWRFTAPLRAGRRSLRR